MVPWLLKLPSGRETDAPTHSAVSVQIVRHATIGRKCTIDTSYRLHSKCLRSVVETHVCVYCEFLVFRQIDAAKCHRHGNAAIETFDVAIKLIEVLIDAGHL